MSNECIGKEVNKDLLDKLNKKLKDYVLAKKVSEENIIESEQFFKTSLKDEDGKDIYIFADEEGKAPEEYTVLSELITYVSFEKAANEEVYEIPGVVITNPTDPDKKETQTFYITKNNAKLIAENEKKYRDILKIEFPDELFQLYHENIIPGVGYKAPLPKKYSETEEEYEARLETEYQANGVNKEELEEYRKPYPHEMVRYNNPVPEMTDVPRASYQTRLNQKGLSPAGAEPGGPGTPEGQRRRVTGTDQTLGQKLYQFLQTAKGIKASKDTVKRVIGTVATGIIVGGTLITWPLPTLAILTSTGTFLGIGYVGRKYGKKAIKAIKTKWNNWLKGAPMVEEPEQPTTPVPSTTPTTEPTASHGGPTPTETPTPTRTGGTGSTPAGTTSDTPEETQVPEDLVAVLGDIEKDSAEINNIENHIKLLEETIKGVDGPEKEALEAQLTELRNQKRQYLVNVYDMLQQYINGKKINTGGPSL